MSRTCRHISESAHPKGSEAQLGAVPAKPQPLGPPAGEHAVHERPEGRLVVRLEQVA
ncbi:MAG: hypothetical protein QOE29_1956, partial [Gaiellaceae bacterium]|nr:hypothetical protein [Gaiellaceae bacterium]